jgi:hypothetical protein
LSVSSRFNLYGVVNPVTVNMDDKPVASMLADWLDEHWYLGPLDASPPWAIIMMYILPLFSGGIADMTFTWWSAPSPTTPGSRESLVSGPLTSVTAAPVAATAVPSYHHVVWFLYIPAVLEAIKSWPQKYRVVLSERAMANLGCFPLVTDMSKSIVIGWPGAGDAGVMTMFVIVAAAKISAGDSNKAAKINRPSPAFKQASLNFFIKPPPFPIPKAGGCPCRNRLKSFSCQISTPDIHPFS